VTPVPGTFLQSPDFGRRRKGEPLPGPLFGPAPAVLQIVVPGGPPHGSYDFRAALHLGPDPGRRRFRKRPSTAWHRFISRGVLGGPDRKHQRHSRCVQGVDVPDGPECIDEPRFGKPRPLERSLRPRSTLVKLLASHRHPTVPSEPLVGVGLGRVHARPQSRVSPGVPNRPESLPRRRHGSKPRRVLRLCRGAPRSEGPGEQSQSKGNRKTSPHDHLFPPPPSCRSCWAVPRFCSSSYSSTASFISSNASLARKRVYISSFC